MTNAMHNFEIIIVNELLGAGLRMRTDYTRYDSARKHADAMDVSGMAVGKVSAFGKMVDTCHMQTTIPFLRGINNKRSPRQAIFSLLGTPDSV